MVAKKKRNNWEKIKCIWWKEDFTNLKEQVRRIVNNNTLGSKIILKNLIPLCICKLHWRERKGGLLNSTIMFGAPTGQNRTF